MSNTREEINGSKRILVRVERWPVKQRKWRATCPKCKQPGRPLSIYSKTNKYGYYPFYYYHSLYNEKWIDIATNKVIKSQIIRKKCFIGPTISFEKELEKAIEQHRQGVLKHQDATHELDDL
jgi:hypothetical protein